MIVIVFVYQLKVFDTCFIYTPVEIKYKGLDLFVPLWRLVKEEHDSFRIVYLKLLLNRLIFLKQTLIIKKELKGLLTSFDFHTV